MPFPLLELLAGPAGSNNDGVVVVFHEPPDPCIAILARAPHVRAASILSCTIGISDTGMQAKPTHRRKPVHSSIVPSERMQPMRLRL